MDEFTFALDFLKKEQMPEEAIECMSSAFDKLKADDKCMRIYKKLKRRYLYVTHKFKSVQTSLGFIAKKLSISEETAHFMFLILCLDVTKKRYEQDGLSDDLFYSTFADFKYKMLECKKVKNEWGTFVAGWYDGFFRLERFTYGRFQYEITKYAWLKYDKYGVKLRKNTKVLNFHIPSSGEPLTYETRLASYKLAYDNYRKLFNTDKAVFVCTSWLLYKEHYDFLPERLNIIDFMNDFDIVKSISLPVFSDSWRVFGADAKKPAAQLPENTSLQRAYKKRLMDKKHGGVGYGVLVFDGENILTRKSI